MRTYEVIVTEDITQSAIIIVQARNVEDAEDKALDKARTEACDWEVNDANAVSPYLGAGSDDITEL